MDTLIKILFIIFCIPILCVVADLFTVWWSKKKNK